jgi:hypothetical protein
MRPFSRPSSPYHATRRPSKGRSPVRALSSEPQRATAARPRNRGDGFVRVVATGRRVGSRPAYRGHLGGYLHARMHGIAPSLTTLEGGRMGAQLIMASESLIGAAAKAPASTVRRRHCSTPLRKGTIHRRTGSFITRHRSMRRPEVQGEVGAVARGSIGARGAH